MYITEDHLAALFSDYGPRERISWIKSKSDIATSDFDVVVEGCRLYCWTCTEVMRSGAKATTVPHQQYVPNKGAAKQQQNQQLRLEPKQQQKKNGRVPQQQLKRQSEQPK